MNDILEESAPVHSWVQSGLVAQPNRVACRREGVTTNQGVPASIFIELWECEGYAPPLEVSKSLSRMAPSSLDTIFILVLLSVPRDFCDWCCFRSRGNNRRVR